MLIVQEEKTMNWLIFILCVHLIHSDVQQPMFEDANTYSKLSKDHRNEAKWILDNYGHKLTWSSNETVLDVGCGSGDVTVDILYSHIKNRIKSLTGIDMHTKMIDYARKHHINDQIKFELMDFNKPVGIRFQPFDKIFSFFALQWVQDRKTLGENVYNLLKPGGQAFLLVVANSGIYVVWDQIAKSPKWKTYLSHAPEHLNEYVYSPYPLELFTSSLKSAGLNIEFAEKKERKQVFHSKNTSDEALIEKVRSVDPYVSSIPENLKMDYLKDVIDLMKKDVSPLGATDYTALIIITSRPLHSHVI